MRLCCVSGSKLLLERQFFPALVIVLDVATSKALSVHLAVLVYLKASIQRLNLGQKCYCQSGYRFAVSTDWIQAFKFALLADTELLGYFVS